MPTATLPQIPHYVAAKPTREDLDYADLAIIDLSKASTPEGRAALAIQARDAMRGKGFFYVINHGWTQEQSDRIFDIADVPFTQVSDEDKQKYDGRMLETGSYQGYKQRSYWHIDNGVRDQIEHYNVNKDVTRKEHPEAIRPLIPEIDEFAKHNHLDILHPILRLLALGMELPEDAFVKSHGFEVEGETWVRFMKYYPRTEEDEARSKQVWLKGHTDFGSITILWSQPVSALQILSPEGKWEWIKHIPNALVINAGDSLEFLSGGFYRPAIHRVVQPPKDQRNVARLGAFYFAMPDDNIRLVPFAESPALQRVGIRRRMEDKDALLMKQWRTGRIKAYGRSELKKKEGENVEEEIIDGVIVKHYN